VRVLDGDALLRPEMLAQVRFFGRPREDGDPAPQEAVVLVPARLVADGHVWIVGAGDVAVRRRVEVGGAHGDLVEVRSGVNLTDKLIDDGRDGLAAGDPVRMGGAQ